MSNTLILKENKKKNGVDNSDCLIFVHPEEMNEKMTELYANVSPDVNIRIN